MIVYGLHTHRADLIRYQRDTVAKFCAGIEQYAVVNNGPGQHEVQAECDKLGVECLFLGSPGLELNHSWATAHSLTRLMWTQAQRGPKDVLILDIDIFPTTPCSPREWLTDAPFAAIELTSGNVGHAKFPFPGLMAIRGDMPSFGELSFCPAFIGQSWCDTGAGLINQMADSPAFCWHRLPGFVDVTADDLPESLRSQFDPAFGFSNAGGWFHVSKATNWDRKPAEFVRRKDALWSAYLDSLLAKA